MRSYVYYDEIKNYIDSMNITIVECLLKKISFNSFFVLNNENKSLKIYVEKINKFIDLPYEAKNDIFNEEIEKEQKKINLITAKTENGILQFYANKENNNELYDLVFTNESEISFDKKEYLPDFIKYLCSYKKYDIEWVGENYQVSDYMTQRLISKSHNLKQVYSDIDSFLEWKNKISTDSNFYQSLGYNISVVSSGIGYPAFPYTFEITTPENSVLQFYGISNVFETYNEAIIKACYVINDLINKDIDN